MKQIQINQRITEIIKICASDINPKLLDVASDDEMFDAFDMLNNKCIQMKIKHNGYVLIEAVVRKLAHDKLHPNLVEDTTKTSVEWIQHQMKFKNLRYQ